MEEPQLEASPKEKFDTLFGLLKDNYAGLFDFEFKNVTVLTLLLGWTLASNDARSFLHDHRGIACCACVAVLLYAALLLISVWKFYRRSLLAYTHLSELGYADRILSNEADSTIYSREFRGAELGRSLSHNRCDSLHVTHLEKWPNQGDVANGSVVHAMDVYEVRSRTDKRGVHLVSDALPFGLWFVSVSDTRRVRQVLQPVT